MENAPAMRSNIPADKEIARILSDDPNIRDIHIEFARNLMIPKGLRPSRESMIGKYNLSESNYYYYMRHPSVIKIKRILTKRYFHDDIPDILQALRDEAIAGNERAARTFLEYVDEWKAEDEQEKNKRPNINIYNVEQVNVMLNEFRDKKV